MHEEREARDVEARAEMMDRDTALDRLVGVVYGGHVDQYFEKVSGGADAAVLEDAATKIRHLQAKLQSMMMVHNMPADPVALRKMFDEGGHAKVFNCGYWAAMHDVESGEVPVRVDLSVLWKRGPK